MTTPQFDLTETHPAVVIVAHDEPAQLHRLVAALDPFPIFLHVDANTPGDVYAEMTEGLPSRVHHVPRLAAGWARPEVVQAELIGLRQAMAETDADHFILLTGTDHPVRSTQQIAAHLAAHPGRSALSLQRLPVPEWGRLGGYDRFIAPQWPWRRRRLLAPLPRLWPRGLVLAGAGQQMVLSRRHAQVVMRALDSRPELWRYFRRTWAPDESLVPTLLASPSLGVDWDNEHIPGLAWYIDWGRKPVKSPRWLTPADLPAIAAAREEHPTLLFARKVGQRSGDLAGRLDELRHG